MKNIKKFIPLRIKKKLGNMRQRIRILYIKISKIKPLDLKKYSEGINLIGPFVGNSGLSQSCRLLEQEIQLCNIDYCKILYPCTEKNVDSLLQYGINIFHVNAHEFPEAFWKLGKKCWSYHYNIAFWLWELEDFPEEWITYQKFFHEIWTPADYISDSIRKKVDIPVKTMPYYLMIEYDTKARRKDFDLPEGKFLFLMAFDSYSVIERKNPYGVIQAFKKAFSKEISDVGLVIKINHLSSADKRKLNESLEGYNVYFVDEIGSKEKMNSLIHLVDVYVSLHRAEGFGLIMAESMLLETPVIATAYSANMEFMNSDVACLVNYKLVKLEKDIWPYKKGNYWADPDINQASIYMKELYENSWFYNELKIKAYKYIQNQLSQDKIVNKILERYKDILSLKYMN